MSKIISIHAYILKPNIEGHQIEQAFQMAKAQGLFDLPGLVDFHFLKGIKGTRNNQYSAIWIYESREAWEALWGSPEQPIEKAAYPEKWLIWEDQILAPLLTQDPDMITFTSYEDLTNADTREALANVDTDEDLTDADIDLASSQAHQSGEATTNTPGKLKDIAEALGIQSEGIHQYLNRETGEVVMVSDEEISAVERGNTTNYPDWQQEIIDLAAQIHDDTDEMFVELPSQFDIHEYRIMEDFCYTIKDLRISEALLHAIKGRGAFRRFKDKIHQYGVTDAWYAFQAEAFKKMAIKWCEENNIMYT